MTSQALRCCPRKQVCQPGGRAWISFKSYPEFLFGKLFFGRPTAVERRRVCNVFIVFWSRSSERPCLLVAMRVKEYTESMVHVMHAAAAVEVYLHSRCTAFLRAEIFLRGVIY